jgi:hypothetical protein
MALNNYANLKAAVIDYSGRDDLSARIDDFIQLCETDIYYNEKTPLRIRTMETTVQLSTVAGAQTLALPSDYLESRSASIEAGGAEYTLAMLSPSSLPKGVSSGIPRAFTVTDTIKFDRTPDGVYTINFTYYALPTPLSSSNQVNTVLTLHPNIYLFGTLAQVYDFSGEPQMSEHYFNKMLRAIRGAIRGDRSGQYSPGAQAVVRGSTP